METYVKRQYGHAKSENVVKKKNYPFWDYRSRRGSIPSSCSASSDGSSISSMGSSRSEQESDRSSLSASDNDSAVLCDPSRLTIQLSADPHELYPMLDMYQPIINWVDPDLHLFKMTEHNNPEKHSLRTEMESLNAVPSVAIMVFLHEEGMVGCERIQTARAHFEKSPWKYHHSEEVGNGSINPYPYNSQDFYYTSSDLPLWAVRQVHYGKEHIRVVVYTSDENWTDMVSFYKLILGSEPDLLRKDFCMFTVHTQIHYDIQFALKKLPRNNTIRKLDCVQLQFRVSDLGQLVPLFPNVCQPLSDTKWQTTDHDGNSINLDVQSTPAIDRHSHHRIKPKAEVGFYV